MLQTLICIMKDDYGAVVPTALPLIAAGAGLEVWMSANPVSTR